MIILRVRGGRVKHEKHETPPVPRGARQVRRFPTQYTQADSPRRVRTKPHVRAPLQRLQDFQCTKMTDASDSSTVNWL